MFHAWLGTYTMKTTFDRGDMAACWYASQRNLTAEGKEPDPYQWKPIETAPRNNKRPLLLARFNDDGTLQSIDYDGAWESERESWEQPDVYWFWASANGYVEEPSHWMYQPNWYAKIPALAAEAKDEPQGSAAQDQRGAAVAENSVGQPDKSGHLQTARQDHPESVATTQPAPHQQQETTKD